MSVLLNCSVCVPFHCYINSLAEQPLLLSFNRSCPTVRHWCPIIWISSHLKLWKQTDNKACHLKGYTVFSLCHVLLQTTVTFVHLSILFFWPLSPFIKTCFCKSHNSLKSCHQRRVCENLCIKVNCNCSLYFIIFFLCYLQPNVFFLFFFWEINLVSAQLHDL